MFIDLQNKVFGFTPSRPLNNKRFSIQSGDIYVCKNKIITCHFITLLYFYAFCVTMLFIGITFTDGYSQPQFEWIRNYPMIGQDAALDSAGNIYILGKPANNNVHILKYNPSGSIIWSRELATVNSNNLYAASDKFGNVYFSFCDNNDSHFRLTKYDSSGNFQWNRFFVPGGYNTYTRAIALDTSGNIFVIGNSQTFAGGPFILKYNAQGDLLWSVSPSISGNDFLWSGFVDRPGNVYATGYCADSNNYAFDYLTIKFNSAGVLQWAKRYNGPVNGPDGAGCVKADNEGYCYVTGSVDIGGPYNGTSGTIKYAPNGDTVWTRLYSRDTTDQYGGEYLEIDSDGNVYVTGGGYNPVHLNGEEFRTIKYDKYGNILWTIHDTNSFYPSSIIIDRYKNIYITTYNFYSTGYNEKGNTIWNLLYPAVGGYGGRKVLIDKFNNLFVVGSGADSSIVIKYSISTGIVNPNQNVVPSYKLYQNYPNPFNSMTNVKWSMLKAGNAKIIVHDLRGCEIQTLVNENLNAGIYEVKFEGGNLSTGVYFYTLILDGQKMDIKKMIVIK